MLNVVPLLAAAVVALMSLQAFAAHIDNSKIEMDNNLLPNEISVPAPRRHVPRKYVRISSPPTESLRSEPGSTLVLECEAMGNPAPVVGWMKNGVLVTDFEEGANEILSTPISAARVTSKLVVQSPSNGDVFTCMASAGLLEDSASTTVYVEGDETESLPQPTKPLITEFYNDILQSMGSVLTLPCRVYSPTKSQVYWLDNNDKIVYGNGRIRVLPSGDLRINNLLWADMGGWTCTVKNMYGKDSAETFLYPLRT